VRAPFRLVSPGTGCEGCGARRLADRDEALWIFEDLLTGCEFPTGSRHADFEGRAAARRAEVWRLTVAEAEAVAPPHLGAPTAGRRRHYRPARGNVECYECGGDGACVICEGSRLEDGQERCSYCQGWGRCIVCRGAGEFPE